MKRTMSSDPQISIIMPVYNGEEFLEDSIESVLSQSYDSFELIIINDGSTDGSERIIKNYLPNEHIRYFSQQNKGVTATTNRGVNLARGDYLSIHPQDDISLPDRFEKQAAILEENPSVELVYCKAIWINLQGEPFDTMGDRFGLIPSHEAFYELYINGLFFSSPSALFRTRHIDNDDHPWGDPGLDISSDYQHWLEITQNWDIFGIDEPLIKLQRDEEHDNISSDKEQLFDDDRRVVKLVREKYRDGNNPVKRRHYYRAMSNIYLNHSAYQIYSKRAYLTGLKLFVQAVLYYPFNKKFTDIPSYLLSHG